ncbi:cell envelope biogenesis protein OmpA [Kitasatospora sp. NBC_00240]|uniref:cell envelope biogenesis protein OmpA n=1 Tax=Kitasatospora sp. NBC_00240 TaxID=2903567 RepID=UPI00224FF230|nr:cell envelope biogenesis protein OmpA [Kitasatospora sp. NBC_00240]MCX5215652.1 cell envelope biogenesis protein OmpA [Kitasatospora sp. NBC_00240]
MSTTPSRPDPSRGAAAGTAPSIPARCASRPRSGGLVVPWITFEHGGHAAFGTVDERKRIVALINRLCQVCGQRLENRIFLVVRPSDVRLGHAFEPGVHPECLPYSEQHCPMLNGAATTYRQRSVMTTHPAGRPCNDPSCPCSSVKPAQDDEFRVGQPADDFDGWMIDAQDYQVMWDPQDKERPLGLDLDVPVLRMRPIRRNPRPDLPYPEEFAVLLKALGLGL